MDTRLLPANCQVDSRNSNLRKFTERLSRTRILPVKYKKWLSGILKETTSFVSYFKGKLLLLAWDKFADLPCEIKYQNLSNPVKYNLVFSRDGSDKKI